MDKYQGQQNDYILLSLVKTRAVGHLRDARRLVVAMSRARLGLYVFARVSLFKNCFELTPAFDQLMRRPLNLALIPSENYPTARLNEETPAAAPLEIVDMPHMAKFVYDFYLNKVNMKVGETRIFIKSWTVTDREMTCNYRTPLSKNIAVRYN